MPSQAERDIWTDPHSFTASKHLWHADSSASFYRAWREKPLYWIENLAFTEPWTNGRAADLDEFSRLIMTSYVVLILVCRMTPADSRCP